MFAVTTMRGPAWDTSRGIREQELWEEHGEFADKMVADGQIRLGGPVEDPDPRVVALIAMEVPRAAAVYEVFADDPWVKAGILQVKDVRPWTIWLSR